MPDGDQPAGTEPFGHRGASRRDVFLCSEVCPFARIPLDSTGTKRRRYSVGSLGSEVGPIHAYARWRPFDVPCSNGCLQTKALPAMSVHSLSALLIALFAVVGLAGCSVDRARFVDVTTDSPGWSKSPLWYSWEGTAASIAAIAEGPEGDTAFELMVENKSDAPIRVSLHSPRESVWTGPLCTFHVTDARGDPVQGGTRSQPEVPLAVGDSVVGPPHGIVSMYLGQQYYDCWPPATGSKSSFSILVYVADAIVDNCQATFVVARIRETATIRKHWGH